MKRKYTGYIFVLLLMLSLKTFGQAPINDNYINAIELADLNNWSSENKAYTTVGATRDGTRNGCQPFGPVNNVWFKFQATSKEIDIKLKTGGIFGTITQTSIALWKGDLSQIVCNKFYMNYSISLQHIDLVVGEWYYFSIDNQNGGAGTFSISVNQAVGFDSWQKAYEINDLNHWSSGNAQFSTADATPDRTKPSCMYVGTNNNVWFKFRASSTDIDVRLKRGGEEGTMGSSFLTICDQAFLEVGCITYTSGQDLTLQRTNLAVGNLYYIMVDNATGEAGTFTLEVKDKLGNDVRERAMVIENTDDWCSDLKQFDNINATRDGIKGTCWINGPNKNVWFKFLATTNEIDIRVKTGNEEGTLTSGGVSLWNSSNTEIGCSRFHGSNIAGDLTIQKTLLVPGEWYFISVDGTGGSFTLCINNNIDFDLREKAVVLTDVTNWCSSLQEFSNAKATPDGTKGSCWNNGPNKNVWFKFLATTNEIDIRIKTGNEEGTLTSGGVSLWNSSNTEIGCSRFHGSNIAGDLTIQKTLLVPGEWYFISVDGTGGSFTLCINNNIDFDLREKAVVLTDVSNWCSSLQEFSNAKATPDGTKGSCWDNGPNRNVWFKFKAISNEIVIKVSTGGNEGTLTYGALSIWDKDSKEVGCVRYSSGNVGGDIALQKNNLVVGQDYWMSVEGFAGTFSLCIKSSYDVGKYALSDFKSKSSGSWNSHLTWKKFNGEWFIDALEGEFPEAANTVFLESGHTISLTSEASCKDLNLNSASDVVRLNSSENVLNVFGKLRLFSPQGFSPGIPGFITTGTNGRIRLKGTSNRVITEKDEFSDHENLKGWTLECDLAEGVIGTINSNFRAGNVIITSGNLEVKSKNFKVSK